MRTVSVGFIGAGFSAHLHVEGLKKVFGVTVHFAGVTATQRERAAEFARAHGVAEIFATWQELITSPAIEVVCICVPNGLHAEIAIAAASAGKHVICEKPMTGAFGPSHGLTGVERAHNERKRAVTSIGEIRDAMQKAGVLFLYAENWVYAPATIKTKRLLEISKGAIIDIRAEESHSGSHALIGHLQTYDRTSINSWEDTEFKEAVKALGRRKLIMTALRTEACLTFPALSCSRRRCERVESD